MGTSGYQEDQDQISGATYISDVVLIIIAIVSNLTAILETTIERRTKNARIVRLSEPSTEDRSQVKIQARFNNWKLC